MIWAQSKGDVAHKNTTFKTTDVIKLLETALENVSPENWRKAEDNCIRLEEKIHKTEIRLDLTVPEEQLNTFRFYISDNDDSSSSDENSDDEILVQPQALELQITTSPRR